MRWVIIWLRFPDASEKPKHLSQERGLGTISQGVKKSSWSRLVPFHKKQTSLCWELQKAFLCKTEVSQEPPEHAIVLRMLFHLNGLCSPWHGVHDGIMVSMSIMHFFHFYLKYLHVCIFAALTYPNFFLLFTSQRPDGEPTKYTAVLSFSGRI